jgi:hypothetical protein
MNVINELVNDMAAKGKASHIPKVPTSQLPESSVYTMAPSVDQVTQLLNQLSINRAAMIRMEEGLQSAMSQMQNQNRGYGGGRRFR